MLVEANRGRKAAERSAAAKWSMLYETSLVKSMRAELAWMEASEEEKVGAFEKTQPIYCIYHRRV